MDNYNSDLIFDLAAGLLPEDEARAAEASLSAEGRAELEAQRAVLAAIAASPPAEMTDIERAGLHRSIAAGIAETTRELSPVEVAPPGVAGPSRRSVVWMRWAPAAAVAAVFIGVVGVASQVSSPFSRGDSADNTVAAALAATTTTAAGTEAAPLATTAPAGATMANEFAGDGALGEAGAGSEPALVRSESAEEDLATLAREIQTTQRSPISAEEDLTQLACYNEAMQDLTIVDWSRATFIDDDGTEIEAIGYADKGGDDADLTITLYDVSSCEPIVTDE